MINKYPFFKYITGESSIHLMNSSMKILWFLLTIICSLLLNDYISAFIIMLFLLFIMNKSKIELSAYVNNVILLWPLYGLVLLISFFFSFSMSFAFLMAIKIIMIVLIFLILTFTTSLSEIAWGFECLFSKLKKMHFPVTKIALKVALGIKFIATLFEQFSTIRKSMAYRGIPYKKGGSIKLFKLMLLPAIRLSYKLSLRMGVAMKLRFYGDSKRRTNYHENKVTSFDKNLIIISFLLIYVVVWLGWV